MLGEIADFQSLGGPALARQRRQLSGQGLDKRALARSVYTQHADVRATAHHKLYVAQDLAAATVCALIAGGYLVQHQQRVGHAGGFGNAYIYARFRLRSEEHTSELQSLMRISYAVFCLKNKKLTTRTEKLLQSNFITRHITNKTKN